MAEFQLEANMHQMKHWADYLESDSDSKSEKEEDKDSKKAATKPIDKEKKETNPYMFKNWRDLLDSDSDKEEEDQIKGSSNDDNDDEDEESNGLLNVLKFGSSESEDTDEDTVERPEKMMSPPVDDVQNHKEKLINRTLVDTKEEPEYFHKSQNNGWGDNIDLGMFDTGMTTIFSPRYTFKDDVNKFDEQESEHNQISNDHKEQIFEKNDNSKDTDSTDNKGVTYNDSHSGQLEADLDEARSDFKTDCALFEFN